ncbi:MAG: RlmE family RNA methyltransferase [Candidatus Absconditabacterales bacterium]
MFKFEFQDHYFKKAKKEGYKARSAFKLEEIQNKFHIFDKHTKTILDIGCAPGSRIQYAVNFMNKNHISDYKILGVDIQDVNLNLPGVKTYKADIQDVDHIKEILIENNIKKVDLIQSDMAPNTIGVKDVDAMRLFELLEYVKPILKNLLKPEGKFVIKVFMGPGFEQFIKEMKDIFGGNHIKTLKPASCRKESKEIYVIKI